MEKEISKVSKEKDKIEKNRNKKSKKDIVTPKNQKDIKKKKTKKWVIISLILVVLLSLGFGLGFGIDWSGEEEGRNPFPGSENQVDDDMNKVQTLQEFAAYWAYDQLHDYYGLVDDADYNRIVDDAKDDAENTIDNEKENYRDQYGKEWESEWDSYLIDNGYDDEDQYENSLISEQLKNETDDVILSNSYKFEQDENIYSSARYKSTLPDYNSAGTDNEGYWIVNYGEPLGEGATSLDMEMLYQGYTNLENPVSYYDILLPFTFAGKGSSDGLYGTRIEFNDVDSPDNLEAIWNFASDYYLSWNATFNDPMLIEKDLTSFDNVTNYQISLNDLADNVFVSNAMYEMFWSDFSTDFSIDFENDDYSNLYQQQADNFYNVNDQIGNTLLLDIYTNGLNDGEEVWPGYVYNSNDADNTIPNSVEDKVSSINDIKEGPSGGTQQNYFDQILSTQEEIIGLNLFNALDDTKLFTNENRNLYQEIPLNYNSKYYQIENNELTFNLDSENDIQKQETVYLTLDSSGIHILSPMLYFDPERFETKGGEEGTDVGDYSYGELMLISDLDRYSLEGSQETKPPESLVKQNFDSWFREVSGMIYLNQALDDEEFVSEYLQDMDDNGTIDDEDLNIVIENFYNYIYNSHYQEYLNIKNNISDFSDDYSGLYDFNAYNGDENLEILKNYLVFFNYSETFSWTPINEILLNGSLGGVGK